MKIDKTTCWYNSEICPNQMVLGATGKLFPKLEHSDHFSVLQRLIDKYLFHSSIRTVFDLGCGSGDVGRLFGASLFYSGGDLPHIIENVAKVVNPTGRFQYVDVINDDLSFLKSFDLVLMNAFIDVMQHPLEVLQKVLKSCQNFVLIHRQSLSIKHSTHVVKHPSYGSFSYQSIIAEEDFRSICDSEGFEEIKREMIYQHNPVVDAFHQSILLRKHGILHFDL